MVRKHIATNATGSQCANELMSSWKKKFLFHVLRRKKSLFYIFDSKSTNQFIYDLCLIVKVFTIGWH